MAALPVKHSGSMITTPPGGMKPSGTGSPKGTATPFRGNKGGFNPANPGAGAGTKAPSATPKLTGTPRLPGSSVTPGTQLQGSPVPKPTGRGESATPTPHVTAPVSTPKPAEHLATPPPTPHHSATPAPTSHPTVHLATPPPHHATPMQHPHTTSATVRLGFWFWRDLEFEAELRAWCYHKPQSPYSSSSLDGSNPACEPMGIAGRLLDQNRSMLGFRRHRDFED
jgi:hypothetical protein